MERKEQKDINLFNKGLHTDTNEVLQPKGSYKFALNAIANTEEGNIGLLSNEPSNIECGELPIGFKPIGKCYIGDNETCLFLVNPETGVSEIGVFKDCKYQTYLNDKESPENERLNFQLTDQIQATYRLRRGCEKNVYFTDGINEPRVVNLNNLNSLKNERGLFDKSKFKLFKTIDQIPQINLSETYVLEGGGSLKAGSYSIYVQYLDSDLNPTKYIELLRNINIYNDRLNNNYSEIGGSIFMVGEDKEDLQYEDTSKAIQVDIINKNLDFTYVRYAFVEFTSGTGQASSVVLTDYLPIENSKFIYTGKNGLQRGTLEEIKLFGESLNIHTAEHIEQINNRLVLANIRDKQVDYSKFQKYASKIQADCRVRPVNLNSIGTSKNNYNNRQNPKNPLYNNFGVGYMPGEIYAFGIVYIFEDGSESPVFHIPGKSSKIDNNKVYSPGQGIFPMSNKENTSLSTYTKDVNCNTDFWGVDCEGYPLLNTSLRFHRFPTRDEVGVPLVSKQSANIIPSKDYFLQLEVIGIPKPTVVCQKNDKGEKEDPDCQDYTAVPFELELTYKQNDVEKVLNLSVEPDNESDTVVFTEPLLESDTIEIVELKLIKDEDNSEIVFTTKEITENELNDIKDTGNKDLGLIKDNKVNITNETFEDLQFAYYFTNNTESQDSNLTYSNIFGIKFSNISIPTKEEVGMEIVGYKIVRLQREDSDKTIIDTGVLLPVTKFRDNSGIASLVAETLFLGQRHPADYPTYIEKDKSHLVSLEHKFNDKTPDQMTYIKEVGYYGITGRSYQVSYTHNVSDGSSADGIKASDTTKDNDGMDLKIAYQHWNTQYAGTRNDAINLDFVEDNVTFRLLNLNAVEYGDTLNDKRIYNLSADERALVLNTSKNHYNGYSNQGVVIPYVQLGNNNKAFYQNYRTRKYIDCSSQIYTSDTTEIYGGDTHISPLRLSNMFYLSTYQAMRAVKKSFGAIVGGLIAFVGAVFLAPFTAGTSLGLLGAIGVGLIGAAGLLTAIGATVKADKFQEVYGRKWKEGLAVLARDLFFQRLFVNPDQIQGWERPIMWKDDTIGWGASSVGDLWFESTVNSNLRVPLKTHQNNFLKPQTAIPTNDVNQYIIGHTKQKARKHRMSRSTRVMNDYAMPPIHKEQLSFYNRITKDAEKPTESKAVDYTGIPMPIMYIQNPDYTYTIPLKYSYMLPLNYNFCSDCIEKFPHRLHYSEQSFQEETTDNYRIFLPNNYRDIEGETGEITNIFRYNNNLYIHTEEALWLQPSSLQERVTGDIVTFIGTGSFFEVPPQKLIDDETGLSAGTIHKWASIKTPVGYYFISANNKSIYQFDGKTPKPISNKGISKWFNENISTLENNPSNIESSGYISTYDSENYRVIFTQVNRENSWTISYSPILESWISYHSYTPNFYFNALDRFYSWVDNNRNIWRHNNWGNYQTYYNRLYPHIVEYVVNTSPIQTKIWNDITIQTKAQVYNSETKTYVEDLYTTFNKGIIYNDRQTTGELNLIVKDDSLYDENYLINQVESSLDNISIIDRTEKNWFINDFRDIRVDYNQPIWRKVNKDIQKELNTNSLDIYKDWTQLESFRDKYLGVRLIFDKFADRNLITKFTYESESLSSH